MDVEEISREAKICFVMADKTLVSFYSEVGSYQSKQGVSGWNPFRWGAAVEGSGSLGK